MATAPPRLKQQKDVWEHLTKTRTEPMELDTQFAAVARRPLLLGFVGGGIMGLVFGVADTLGNVNELRKTMNPTQIAKEAGKSALTKGFVATAFFGTYHLISSQFSSWDVFEPHSYEAAAVSAAICVTPFVFRPTWRTHLPLCLIMVGMDVFDRYRTQESFKKK